MDQYLSGGMALFFGMITYYTATHSRRSSPFDFWLIGLDAGVGTSNVVIGLRAYIEGRTTAGAMQMAGGVFILFAAWVLWRNGRPPRKRRKRIREAVRRMGARLVPVPVNG